MPLQFDSKQDYLSKIEELLLVEAECERTQVESIAAENIYFRFLDRREIYSSLELHIPKTLQ